MTKRRKNPVSLKPFITALLVGGTISYIVFLPPSNIFFVLGLIILSTATTFQISTHFSKKLNNQILIPLFLLFFLSANLFAGFNVLNTILLISFIIGVRLLFR
ncbi:hypothetical protein A3G67_04480 [Candidatus Roizmanbacteria bacterium RIFCSPLOWO2_12_FULL_40_12]|uniref:Uncharacterized protein n=1 Tax=Candidatus Roizmanbacteria bacterium RIFCSPLOWO2_01_FULL_40_42 TaxID=1802066 RepID=A0A1F7J4S0_9BACT|nr:MAG: hypothetical protein A2779_04670 [Candidatus Roizmanbacteria bacterium RIFCSPHIGHO2_01_FULL_40_98]OGK27367.1 MAG: hypothetical protein A3C31_04995 [Candidatus Roizmanbacteria bacterium RIFCSPHIGHO2_02_FULL_40_53]OGK30761.1 MAG: hypothetical protein A2W49_02045 [Candidatus Roizmanbacteria bacterium RIFCSPHIGHO2_12_41_18]OGK36472.1 MAG: hypothetical protein A3E69_02620 [Candidatus Roizmanbacteria bacterium RIFCSPHIGHO2_12_FULL_40_130]OGK50600.1 MAG: hypothetical protein A3B50_02350 [Candi